MDTMQANEESARLIIRAFWEHEEQKGMMQTRFNTPHKINLIGWTNDGKAKVKFVPYQVANVNFHDIDEQTRTGIYATPETLIRAFERLRPTYDDLWTSQRAVFRFRRSGIPEMKAMSETLKADFETVPTLLSRRDDRGIPSVIRAKYALAYSDRKFRQGELTCPHCQNRTWEETILGWTCEGCAKTWIDEVPNMEGWS